MSGQHRAFRGENNRREVKRQKEKGEIEEARISIYYLILNIDYWF
jgi:hypothetical protein